MKKLGHDFEKAVYTFARALDPTSEIIFDHSVLDPQTNSPIQCDVWINAKFGGHWPLSILVSCKDNKKANRKLDSGHIRTFLAEKDATGASTGVIYSNVGFTKPAIKKAKANGIACCRLYQNEPADIPDPLIISKAYCCTPIISLSLVEPIDSNLNLMLWDDLFDIKIGTYNNYKTMIDLIVETYHREEKEVLKKAPLQKNRFPSNWATKLIISKDKFNRHPINILIQGRWSIYQGKLEAFLIDGSYSINDVILKVTNIVLLLT